MVGGRLQELDFSSLRLDELKPSLRKRHGIIVSVKFNVEDILWGRCRMNDNPNISLFCPVDLEILKKFNRFVQILLT